MGRAPKGETGQKVLEAGTYKCEEESTWSYVRGDMFRPCPNSGKSTTWVKTKDPEHPGETR